MTLLLQIALANVAVASLLALLAFGVGKVFRKPALVHGLWVLVLLKLVTPPLFWLPITVATPEEATAPVEANPAECSDCLFLTETVPAKDMRVCGPEQEGWRPQIERIVVPAEARLFAVPAVLSLADQTPPPSPPPSWTATAMAGLELAQPWLPVLVWLWMGGAVAWFVWAGYHLARFQRLLRFATPASPDVQAEADRLAGSMGLSQSPEVWLIPGALPPMVWSGFGKARLFFPGALLSQLSTEERATLLVHELAHVCRRDHWVRGLEMVVLGIYWWCPLAWWARAQLQAREEECCDAWVVGELPPRSYASAILRTLDFLAEHRASVPLGASGLSARVVQLKYRLIQIMQGRTPKRLSSAGQMVVAAVGLLMLPLLPTLVLSRVEAKAVPAATTPDTLLVKGVQVPVQVEFQPSIVLDSAELEGVAATFVPGQKVEPVRYRVTEFWSPTDGEIYYRPREVPGGEGALVQAARFRAVVTSPPTPAARLVDPTRTVQWLAVPGGAGLPKKAMVIAIKKRTEPPPTDDEQPGVDPMNQNVP